MEYYSSISSEIPTEEARILIVEDNFVIADNLRITLMNSGYLVNGIAGSIAEARDQIRDDKPDLVLLDIHLDQERDGIDFSFTLQKQSIPFIFVTSYADKKTIDSAKRSDPYGYLVKPFTQKDIYAAVEIALHKAAFANISRQEYEKRVLLGISTTIAQVRDKNDLWHVIVEKIKPIFNCSDAVISLLDNDESHARIFLKEIKEEHGQHQKASVIYTQIYDLQRGHTYSVLPDNGPLIWNIEQSLHDFPDTDYLRMMHEVGIREGINVWIKYQTRKIGMLNLYAKNENHFKPDQFELLEGITSQLAVAMSNILANEEIQKLNLQLKREKEYLEEEVDLQYNFGEIVGASTAIHELYSKIRQVAPTNTTVLITGETGTGKELVARAIHQESTRKNQTFVKLNCAALPPDLVESELFGHNKGAFTGALKDRVGKFELAHHGTIFLDEVGELPPNVQTKLLRVLQEREIERIGSNYVKKIDVRIIAATNRPLEAEVKKGGFRADLYYRLKIFPIHVPPLRGRKEDIPLLASHFMKQKARNIGKNLKAISETLIKELISYDWPGNIRELEHVIEQAVILNKGTILDHKFHLQNTMEGSPLPDKKFIPKTLKEAETELIMRTLELCQGKVSGPGGAAEILGINSNTLESRMRKYGIQKKHILKPKKE